MSNGQIKTVKRFLRIIEYLMENDGTTVVELHNELDCSKSTAFRHLETLEDSRYLVKRQGRYELSFRFLQICEHLRSRREATDYIRALVDELAEHTGEHAQFLVEENGCAVYVYGNAGPQAVFSGPGVGSSVPLYATAAGKAMLADKSKEYVDEYFTRIDLVSLTQNTLTEEEAIREELDEIRQQGFAINMGENMDRLRAVGVSISSQTEGIHGAVSISGPSRRLSGSNLHEELPNYILGRVNELELNLKLEGDS